MPHKLLTIKNGTHGNLLHDEVFLNIWTEFFAEVPPVDAPLLTTGLNSAQLPMLASRLSQTFSVNVSSMFLLEHPTIRQIATALEDLLSDSPKTYDAPPVSVKTRTESQKNVSLGNVVFHAPGSMRTASSFRFSVERGLNFGSRVPLNRWDVSNATRASATYGNFAEDILTLPHGDWKMSKSELRNVNPVQLLLLEASHSMFDGRHKADTNVGISSDCSRAC